MDIVYFKNMDEQSSEIIVNRLGSHQCGGCASVRQNYLLCKCRTLLIVFLVICLPTVSGSVYYPPYINAALQKPLSLNPPDSICGDPFQDDYCGSLSDIQSVRSCWGPLMCSTSCPGSTSLPHKEDAFNRAMQWPSCITRNSSFGPPGFDPNDQSVHFPGERATENCYLELDKTYMAAIRLMGTWSLTVSLWMYNMLGGTQTGTIFDISNSNSQPLLRFFLMGENLRVQGGGANLITRSEDSWKVPRNKWTHVSVTIHERTIAVYINGDHIAPTVYEVPFSPSYGAETYSVGYSNIGYFVGYMQNFGIFMEAATNREIQEIMTGVLPSARTFSECRCPSSHPALKEDDMNYCVKNPGSIQDQSETYRLNRESFMLEFINDGKSDTAWISRPDSTESGQEQHSVEVDLRDIFEVRHVDIVFYSPYPNVIIIERKASPSADWTPWQYFSQQCVAETGYPEYHPVNQSLTSEDDISCRKITSAEEMDIPYSRGQIVFDILNGRPGHTAAAADTFTDKLREFIKASHIRVTVRGYPFINDPRHRYHGVFEIQVNATCDCHGHASSCLLDEYPYECVCAEPTFTEGRLCDQCQEGAFLDPDKNLYAADLCQLCGCSSEGSVNGSSICDEVGGQCECKMFAEGRACDTCVPGYFNLQENNPDGCEECLCETSGTVNGTNVCDVTSGDCPCKDNVEGQSCDTCKTGHYSLDPDNPLGCSACACDMAGTVAGEADTCDYDNGQCECKPNVEGRACDRCKDEFFSLESKNPNGCKACNCDAVGSLNGSCDTTSGQCYCKPHVTGRTCDVCEEGYYAIDKDDMEANGCSYECACARAGTLGLETRCEAMGGQCRCKDSVEGRACDTCKSATFNFGSNIEDGCSPCECFTSGTVDGSTDCHNTTGQCVCKDNVDSRRCNVCKDGFYGLDNRNLLGCLPCNCDDLGTEDGETCNKDDGQCSCESGSGNVIRGGRTCKSYVDGVDPVFGPMAGGTLITISGGFFGEYNSSYVSVGDIECPVAGHRSSELMVVCRTPSLDKVSDGENMLEENLEITWTRSDGEVIKTEQQFTYMENPKIDSVQPLRTFLEGGITLSVTGDNLNSVAYPILEVTMIYNRDDAAQRDQMTFESPCNVTSNSLMECPTPNITIPVQYLSRRKRDLTFHPRARRQTDTDPLEKKVNNDRLQFYLGFRLDGVMIYRNLSQSNPQYGVIDVYVNPQLSRFEEPYHVRIFRPYWPYSDNYVVIKGDDLDYGAKASDYKVMIGDVSCKDIELSSNQIICTPPNARPPYSDYSHRDGEPHVQVTVGNIQFLAGYLDYEHSFWDNLPFRWGVIGGCAGALLLIILICICCCCCCRKKKEKDDGFDHPQKKFPTLEMRENGKKGNPYIHGYNGSVESYLNPSFATDLLELLPRDLRSRVEECLIDYKRMVAGKIIGEGHYGRVHIGRLNDESFTHTTPVAIKTLKENIPGSSEVVQFLEESTMMKDFHHENVLTLIGVVLENDRPYCILPLMENGDLKSFISNEENLLTVGELIDFGLQISKGMNYLAEQRFVHRDLACRNCMIDQQLCVKVADFGLSRDIYSSEYYRVTDSKRPLPVKWLALESLDAGVFTTKSDVWSYGILLWELLTRGCTPYPDIQSYDLKNYLASGGRMDRPDFAPDEMYGLMLACWDETPGRRPTFYDVILRISDFLEISNSKTVMRDHQSQRIPTVAYRGRSYLSLVGQ